jgi:hypothetical protein
MNTLLKTITVTLFLFSFNSAFAEYKKQYISESNTLVFEDETSIIKLRGIKDSKSSITLSYVVTIKEPMFGGDGTIYISLLDADDFEITQRRLSAVVSRYTGTLRGSFFIEQNEYIKISSVALFSTTSS